MKLLHRQRAQQMPTGKLHQGDRAILRRSGVPVCTHCAVASVWLVWFLKMGGVAPLDTNPKGIGVEAPNG